MATYAIGDIQGCYEALMRLLDVIDFDPSTDRLWLAGDLVNRGPQSAATLRFVRGLGDRAVAVLGNHDLHLLAVAAGGKQSRRDSIDDVLHAPDRDELLDWLRRQPLMHHDAELGVAMIHAGLAPEWTIAEALALAGEFQRQLAEMSFQPRLVDMYGDEPRRWSTDLAGDARLRFVLNCFTRLRYCHSDGRIDLSEKDAPDKAINGDLLPWFAVPGRRSADTALVFGHWSTLGRVSWPEYRVTGLDTGCVWGGPLTAICLETGRIRRVPCRMERAPVSDCPHRLPSNK